jgi:hypothetical protein
MKLNSPYGKLTHHFHTFVNGQPGTYLRQAPDGYYIIRFDGHDDDVKVPQHWVEWDSEGNA